jgi:hypothetical protein
MYFYGTVTSFFMWAVRSDTPWTSAVSTAQEQLNALSPTKQFLTLSSIVVTAVAGICVAGIMKKLDNIAKIICVSDTCSSVSI